MAQNQVQIPEIAPSFFENQRAFSPDELDKYIGRYVAWNLDGSQILASGEDRPSLTQTLRAAGIDPSQVVFDYIDFPDVSQLGLLS
jgi:hypothetical protein